jgi:hypothetical protein
VTPKKGIPRFENFNLFQINKKRLGYLSKWGKILAKQKFFDFHSFLKSYKKEVRSFRLIWEFFNFPLFRRLTQKRLG